MSYEVEEFPCCCGAEILCEFPFEDGGDVDDEYWEIIVGRGFNSRQERATLEQYKSHLTKTLSGRRKTGHSVIILNKFQYEAFGDAVEDAGYVHVSSGDGNTAKTSPLYLLVRSKGREKYFID